MASNKSEASARVSLDPKPFEAGARRVAAAAEKMSSVVTAAFATAGVALLAAFGAKTIGSIISTAGEVLSFGESMANAGKKAGLAAGQFYLLNAAVEKGIGLKTAASLIGENADALNRSANTFRDVSIKLWAVGEKIRGFWIGLMERVAPVLSRMLDGTLGVKLLSAGQKFGEGIANSFITVYQLAKDGKLWSTLKLGLGIAVQYAVERLVWLTGKAAKFLRESFSKSISGGIADGLLASQIEVIKFCAGFSTQLLLAFASAIKQVEVPKVRSVSPPQAVKPPQPLPLPSIRPEVKTTQQLPTPSHKVEEPSSTANKPLPLPPPTLPLPAPVKRYPDQAKEVENSTPFNPLPPPVKKHPDLGKDIDGEQPLPPAPVKERPDLVKKADGALPHPVKKYPDLGKDIDKEETRFTTVPLPAHTPPAEKSQPPAGPTIKIDAPPPGVTKKPEPVKVAYPPLPAHTPFVEKDAEAKEQKTKFVTLPLPSHKPSIPDDKTKGKPDSFNAGKDLGAQLVNTFGKDKFEPSKGLASLIGEFQTLLQDNFSKYKSDETSEPTKTFENNTRRRATGVDSLAAIGAGGNVGLTTVDIQKSQLQELKQINLKLGKLTSGSLQSPTLTGSPMAYSLGVSRTQTSSPVQGVSPAGAH